MLMGEYTIWSNGGLLNGPSMWLSFNSLSINSWTISGLRRASLRILQGDRVLGRQLKPNLKPFLYPSNRCLTSSQSGWSSSSFPNSLVLIHWSSAYLNHFFFVGCLCRSTKKRQKLFVWIYVSCCGWNEGLVGRVLLWEWQQLLGSWHDQLCILFHCSVGTSSIQGGCKNPSLICDPGQGLTAMWLAPLDTTDNQKRIPPWLDTAAGRSRRSRKAAWIIQVYFWRWYLCHS